MLPFIVALTLAYALADTRYLTLAVASGLGVVVALTIGFSLEPFTSVKKLIAVTFSVTVIALILEAASIPARRAVVAVLAVAGGLAAV